MRYWKYPLSIADSMARRRFCGPRIEGSEAQFRRGGVSPTMAHPP